MEKTELHLTAENGRNKSSKLQLRKEEAADVAKKSPTAAAEAPKLEKTRRKAARNM